MQHVCRHPRSVQLGGNASHRRWQARRARSDGDLHGSEIQRDVAGAANCIPVDLLALIFA